MKLKSMKRVPIAALLVSAMVFAGCGADEKVSNAASDAAASAESAAGDAAGAAGSVADAAAGAVDSAAATAESAVADAAATAESAVTDAAATAESAATDAAATADSAVTDAAATAESAVAGATPASPDVTALFEAAKAEGKVNLIALPDTWANYKGVLQAFRDKYPGIENPVANPDGSSADEITAIKTLAGQPDMPAAIDVGPSFTTQLISEKLVVPYKPSTWDQIPDSLKDPDGNWVGAYYGIMAISSNAALVKNQPKTFADLKKPEYKGQIALTGDPRESGSAFASVMAASLANGGSFDDITPGIKYFAELKKSGNYLKVGADKPKILSGETPIVIDWGYNFPGLVPELEKAGVKMNTVVPSDGVYGSYYAQAVVAGTKQENAGKLWIEHIVSDEAALEFLKGGAIPARYASIVDKVSDDIKGNLPSGDLIAKITFPTQAQIDAAKAILKDQWGTMVADA